MQCKLEKLKEQKEFYKKRIIEINLTIKKLYKIKKEKSKNKEIIKSIKSKKIKDYPNYLVCYDGRIYSLKNNLFVKPYKSNNGYNCVCLWNNGKKKLFLIHRIVAEAFIPNKYNFTEINHKDFNVNNNCVDNLEWCSREYNLQYSANAGRTKGFVCRKICQFDRFGNFIKDWNSIKEAAIAIGSDISTISKCCKNKAKTCKGFIFKYKE